MPYYTIAGKHVFMTHHRTDKAQQLALAEKDIRWQAKTFFDTPERREACGIVDSFLRNLAATDPDGFDRDWVQIHLEGDEASNNVWDLLYDYCNLSSAASLIDIRNNEQRDIDNFMNNSYTHPMGKVFAIEAMGPKRWFKRQAGVRVIINAERVSAVHGTLSNFTFVSDGVRIHCSKNLTVGGLSTRQQVLTHHFDIAQSTCRTVETHRADKTSEAHCDTHTAKKVGSDSPRKRHSQLRSTLATLLVMLLLTVPVITFAIFAGERNAVIPDHPSPARWQLERKNLLLELEYLESEANRIDPTDNSVLTRKDELGRRANKIAERLYDLRYFNSAENRAIVNDPKR
ncbi:hypothetical protein [Rhodopirellula sallentina]|nr:hypothetical protein [Rhodopirellula sallentina]